MSKIGFIGLGIMGKPMAKHLIGEQVKLMVNDINQSAVKELTAMGAAQSGYREIGALCDIIFLILPNGSIVQEVLFGENGVMTEVRPGTIICDMSSVTPVESKFCYEKCAEKNVGFLDAPVSGGEPGAVNGTLAFMAGGDQKDFEALNPYFDIMGSSALLIGEPGSGSVTKLANQIIVNNTIAVVSEAFVLAVKAGADPARVYEAIRGGLAGSAVLDAKIPMIMERNFTPGGKISINHKDIKNVVNTAHEIDVPIPFTAQLFEIMQALKVGGHMDEDHGGIVQYFEQLAGVTVEKEKITSEDFGGQNGSSH
ncbi:2-hydroxy-3-oxopropionate reductase [Hespellia stercorisuis]|uniref:2-hydroxy-3-oxopropionate reductase n=1 Tax=Hespellia stercorisuis DSM 15480 TaxID=1121950 RepID=A0A1M6J4N9_9FIRM|nr:2-hydroxy-3-oxopropionate reductase [Hespellia stercorisuis]SHJ41670.1 2-hydroxy-3-oxopropionate reductase [Hespellia stercorisuis DSM 15480]